MTIFTSKWTTAALGVLAFVWGLTWAWYYDLGPFQHDVDSWAVKITNTAPARLPVIELFRDPSLWKGPIIPTLYHASYVIYPSEYSPIVFNCLCFALTAMLLHRMLLHAGLHPIAVTLGIGGWIIYPPFRYLFAYYYAEPVVVLLSAMLLGMVHFRPQRTFLAGLLAGVLLLARPPFLFVIAFVPITLFLKGERKRAFSFALGTAITFLPWGIRNYFVTGTFVPFTVEGGQTLFHGSYLPLDNVHWQEFKEDPVIAKIDQAAPTDPVERMKYLGGIAKQQVLADPLGQAVRSLRKGQRFWMDVEADTFIPNRNTGIAASVILPCMAVGMVRNRRLPIVLWMAIWIFGLWALHAAVFGIHRYSFPVFPLATVLAASAFWPSQATGKQLAEHKQNGTDHRDHDTQKHEPVPR